jgi:hypothetical protein
MAYGNDSNTVLLIHSNDVNGSQLFADSSQAGNGGNRHALTVVGDIAHSTATTKPNLGSSTISCNTSGYLSTPAHTDFYYASGNFTIDLWFYAHALTGLFGIGLVSQYVDANNYFTLELNGTSLRLNSKASGNSLLSQTYLTATINNETWYHAAVVRNGSQMTLYLNGIQKNTATVVTNPPQYNAPLFIGSKTGSSTFGGHWTELRISKGVARTDFPVTFPYTSANQAVILTSPSTSVITPRALGSSLTASVATAKVIANCQITSQALSQVSSAASAITNQVITSATVTGVNPGSATLTTNTVATGDLNLTTETVATINTSAITDSQVTVTSESLAGIVNTDTSAQVDLTSNSVAVIVPAVITSTPIDLTTASAAGLNSEVISQPFNSTFSSINAITPTAINGVEIDTNFTSLSAIQNSTLLPIEFNQVVRVTVTMPLQVAISTSFNVGIITKPTIAPTLAYTSRQNIVLKIKEGLHGGVTIGGVTYEVAQVEGTTDFRGLLTEDQVSSTPSIFVAYSQTHASDNQVLGFNTRQQVEDYFAIFLVADNVTDEYGINAMDIIRAMHRRVLDSLLNWQLPQTQYDLPMMPLVYRGGNAYGLESDSYYWRDDFSCTSQICSLQAQPMF